jgi:uncharacterized protein
MKISVCALFIALLSGCGSSPSTTLYALAATSGTVRQASLGVVEVRRPGIAGYLDRTEILAQWDGQRLQLESNTGWAEPLAAMVGRVLAEDLSDRLQGTIVFAASSDLSLQPATVVELVIRKFDLAADGSVHLNVLWSVRGAGQASARATALEARPSSNETGAVVAAMSGLLGQLADEITKTLLERGATAPSE